MSFRWTAEADDFLRRYYPTHNTKELAEELGVTIVSVRARAERIKIKKDFTTVPEGYRMCYRCKELYQKENKGNGYCDVCNRIRQREKKLEKLLQQNKEKQGVTEQEKCMAETAEQLYLCGVCGQEKKGKEFKFDKRRKRREAMCNVCRNLKNEKTKIERIKDGRGW